MRCVSPPSARFAHVEHVERRRGDEHAPPREERRGSERERVNRRLPRRGAPEGRARRDVDETFLEPEVVAER